MKVEYNFRQMPWSEALAEHAEERLQKLNKFKVGRLRVQVTFSAKRRERWVEVILRGPDMSFQARAQTASFYDSVDKAVTRIVKQLSKKKAKLREHKCIENSKEGKLRRLNPRLETEPIPELRNTG